MNDHHHYHHHQATTPTRQSGIATTYRNSNTKGFPNNNDGSFRYAGSPPQKLTPNKSLNESTFTASTVMLDSSMGSSSNEDSSTGKSQSTSPASSKNSTAASSTAGSQSSVSRRSLINRFRKRRQQKHSNSQSAGLLNKFSALQSQHQQMAQSDQLQQKPISLNNHPVDDDGQADDSIAQQNSQPKASKGSSSSSFTKKSNARKILSSRIALRARSKGLFPKTTPQAPRHPQPQTMPAHPQRQREETESAPTEIMAPTEVMQNLSSARGMESHSVVLSEAGAPTEIMTNQTRTQTPRFRLDPPWNATTASVVTPSPQHALLDDATVTSDQHSVPIQSLFDLQQSSSMSTTNSMENYKPPKMALHAEAAMQSPPRAWKNGPKRSLDSLFAKHERGGLNKKYSDDNSSCFTEERELDRDAVVQRVFSLDKVDLEQEVPLPLPALLSTNPNSKQACAQVRPRHPTEVSLAVQEPKVPPRETRNLNGIPEGTPSQEIDDAPMEDGLLFASQEVHAPSLEEDHLASEVPFAAEESTTFASKLVHPPSISKSGSLEGLAFAQSNDDMMVFEDSMDSLEVDPPSVTQGTDDFDAYDDLDRLQNSPTGSTFCLTTRANPPLIGSLDNGEIPSLQQQEEEQEAPVSQPLTPRKQLASAVDPDKGSSEEGEWNDMLKRYRQRSSDSDKQPTQTSPKPTRKNDEPAPTRKVATSPWKEADKANKFAERRTYGSIKDRIKAFDKPQKVWKPPVKGKTWKPSSKVVSQQVPSPVSNPSLQAVELENNYHYEEKKAEEESFSYVRDDDAEDNVSVKSMKDVWESRISGIVPSDAREDFDIDNDTIRDDDDDDCASVKSLRDAWEIKFSKDDLEIGFDDDLEEDTGTVKSRRDELQKRISGQQGIPRVVSVDECENDDVDVDDGNASVKSLRKRFDTPNAPKRESVNRLRAMFESSGAAKSSPARSRSFRANKSPARAAPGRNRSFSSQGSAPQSRASISHEDEEDPLRRMAMAWSQKRTEAKRKSSPATLSQPRGQEISTSNLDAERMEIDQAPDDHFVSGLQGLQPEKKESRSSPMTVDVGEKAVSPDSNRSYRERSAEMASKNTAQPIRRQASGDAKSAPSMQDRLDRWSSRLKAAKKKPEYVQDSFSMDFSVSDSSMNVASSVENVGQESIDPCAEEEEPLKNSMSMPSKGDPRGRSMDTEYSDAVTLDISIANVSGITDPSSLRTRSQDTLSDVLSSPGRTQVVTSPTRLTVDLDQVSEEFAPERSSNSVPEATGTISSLRINGVIKYSPENGNVDYFSPLSEKARNGHVKFDDDPFTDQFAVEEKKIDGPEPSAQNPTNPPTAHERRSIDNDLFGSVASSASLSLTRFSSSFKKPQTRLRMVPVLRNKSASSNSVASEQPVPENPVKDIPIPKKQSKKVSFKLSDAPSMSSEDDSRATEKTASSSDLSSLPPIPSQFDDKYEAIMQERHQILMERQRAYKDRVAARHDANPLNWEATPRVESTNHSQSSEPVASHRSQESRQSRTQMRLFGRTHPLHSSTQKSNAAAVNKSKAASRSLFSKKAQEQRLAEAAIAPTRISSTVTTPPARQPRSNAASRSLFSKKGQQAPTPVTPPRSEPTEESRGYGYSPKRTGSPLKAAIPRYHPRSPMCRQQQPARKQSTSLYSTVVSTLGFGQTEGAHDIVARLQSYQSAHQPTPKRPEPEPAPLDMDDFADFANFDSGLAADEWL